MNVVIDTNVLCNADRNFIPHTVVLMHLWQFRDRLVLDYNRVLYGEYERELGRSEFFEKWYRAMAGNDLVCFFDGGLTRKVSRQLTALGFNGVEDRVVVGLALHSDHYIVTEDSDFGKGNSIKALEHSDVLDLLTSDLGLTVHDATEACSWLSSRIAAGSA